jgi:DNA-binding transcriptional LysR family regulator
VRSGHTNTLTPDGATYHERITEALKIISIATGAITQPDIMRPLRIWCAPGLASLWLSSRLGEFITDNPDIRVDFRPADEGPDFRSKDVDCDIRYLRHWQIASMSKGLHTLEFARPLVFPVASPAFLARMPPIRCAEDLLRLPLLHEEDDQEWRNWFEAQGVDGGEQLPGARLWQALLTLNAAKQGHGITLANHFLIDDEINSGQLVEVIPSERPFEPVKFGGYTFIAREERWNERAIVRFRQWLKRIAA